LYLGCFPQRSTAALAALPAMSFAPVAPFSDPSFHLLVRNDAALFDVVFSLVDEAVAECDIVWSDPLKQELESLVTRRHSRHTPPAQRGWPDQSCQRRVLPRSDCGRRGDRHYSTSASCSQEPATADVYLMTGTLTGLLGNRILLMSRSKTLIPCSPLTFLSLFIAITMVALSFVVNLEGEIAGDLAVMVDPPAVLLAVIPWAVPRR
jgi:hypothetical protein